MKQEHKNEIKAILILAVGIILLASLVSFVPEDLPWFASPHNVPAKNLIRVTGAYVAGALFFAFGYSSYFLVVMSLFLSWNAFCGRVFNFSIQKLISLMVLFGVISAFFGLGGSAESVGRFERAGLVGFFVSDFLLQYIGFMGTYVVLITLGVLALILTGEFLITPIAILALEWGLALPEVIKERVHFQKQELSLRAKTKEKEEPMISLLERLRAKMAPAVSDEEEEVDDEQEYEYEYEEVDEGEDPDAEEEEGEEDEEYQYEYEEEDDEAEARPLKGRKPNIKIAPREALAKVSQKPMGRGEYKMPSLELLDDPPEVSNKRVESDLISGAKMLEATLASFSVQARVADIERGPAITRYELEPGPGVKVQKFTTLSDDIALAMKAPAVRIVAPIPGKNRVGIEVPNGDSAAVFLKDVLMSKEFQSTTSKLALSLGKDIAGKSMVADLAEMPHLLIAGTTGSGKTVCVNGIIMSILLNATPEEVRFVMIDPKMVELACYNDIPHLLCPTVTDPKKASAALNWVVGEMESRYKQLSKVKVRNIKAFNKLGNQMPYIVVIIDELADLMQVSAKTVEGSIARLAQLSRAVGIHLILATQRPSVDVITGVIKANFPARISFKVASKVDSRTVLDSNGAENLLGKGDMLFIQPGDAKPHRGQGNFVQDKEINAVVDFIKEQQDPIYNEGIIQYQKGGGAVGGTEQSDEYYDQAVQLVMETNQASVSILQRRLRLGYTRAARLVDMMEQNGLVGPYCGSKAREILVDREDWLLEHAHEGT